MEPIKSAVRIAAAELRQILTITSRFPAEEISDGVTVALRALNEAADLAGTTSADAVELRAIADAILAAEDQTGVDPATGAEPDYALAFRGIEQALARLNAYAATQGDAP